MLYVTRFTKQQGFTIIELLIGIIIIGLFSTITISSMRGFGEKKELEAQKDKFVTVLELAKKKARSGDAGGCTQLDHYEVEIQSTTSYQLKPICQTGTGTNETFTVAQSSSARISSYSSSITSYAPISNQVSANCIVINDATADSCYKLTVLESGIINEANQSGANCTCN